MAVWFVAGGGHELGYCHLPLCACDCQNQVRKPDPDRPSFFLLRLFIMICIVSVRTETAPPPPPPPPLHCHINNWPYCLDPQPKKLAPIVQQNSGSFSTASRQSESGLGRQSYCSQCSDPQTRNQAAVEQQVPGPWSVVYPSQWSHHAPGDICMLNMLRCR